MKKLITSTGLTLRIWLFTNLFLGTGCSVYFLVSGGNWEDILIGISVILFSAIGSAPVMIVLAIAIPLIEKKLIRTQQKIIRLLIICFVCVLPYALIAGGLTDIHLSENPFINYWINAAISAAILVACAILAVITIRQRVLIFFSHTPEKITSSKIDIQMNTQSESVLTEESKNQISNKIFMKGIITGVLILVMLIPTFFITNLVDERQQRQQQVVEEVSSKWALPQTITGPYLYIPYSFSSKDINGKEITINKKFILLPENMNLSGKIIPEIRPRSIYKVLLYKSDLVNKGNFLFQIPKDIDTSSLDLQNSKICFGITDFKGIEEKLVVNFNGSDYELAPGLPTQDIDSTGLSANINLSAADIGKSISFNIPLKIKGSSQLHFLPLSGNSSFDLQSSWASPSFDGNDLPGERTISDSGFTARWAFNKANLPFGTMLEDVSLKKDDYVFGVTMVQPADEYAKTSRSIKYAILFIGLTFSLFFIIELLQKRPLHPVQYAMVGIALVIFFSLLLSISEFILFEYAYLIAAVATISLITFYAKSHFQKWKTAGLFAVILIGLYSFIYVLISLEDTALLIGSIGLFIVLALIMYASRKINWYGISKKEMQSANI